MRRGIHINKCGKSKNEQKIRKKAIRDIMHETAYPLTLSIALHHHSKAPSSVCVHHQSLGHSPSKVTAYDPERGHFRPKEAIKNLLVLRPDGLQSVGDLHLDLDRVQFLVPPQHRFERSVFRQNVLCFGRNGRVPRRHPIVAEIARSVQPAARRLVVGVKQPLGRRLDVQVLSSQSTQRFEACSQRD